ncbi:Dph6-related ATP pyrophosphatase [Winogradskyella immobilis]|uniref:Dph6-related ATP pyrophosphatase n=1 Tax=Winogradskyella immobilis TaxID=2816852 RepID=UPI00293E2746|nr:hypothetical protein [Winogradskyella immobilis]
MINYTVEALVTTVNMYYNRVSMHGLRKELLFEQMKALNIDSTIIELPEQPTMEAYAQKMFESINTLKEKGFTHSAFGDIFLEDLRSYRDSELSKQDINTVYLLWKKDTKDLILDFLDLGFKCIVVCANAKYFNKDFVGAIINKTIINNLPKE